MNFKQVVRNELRSIFKYKGLLIIFGLGPIFFTLVFGGVYANDYIDDIPIAILNEDQSSVSYDIENAFVENHRFSLVQSVANSETLIQLVDSGQVAMGIWIPQDLERDLMTGQSATIAGIVDGTNNVVAGNAYAQASTIIQTISAGAGIKLMEGHSIEPANANAIARAFTVNDRLLYDSKMTYMNYLILCLFAVYMQQMLLAAMGVLFNRDREFLKDGHMIKNGLAIGLVCLIAFLPSTLISLGIIRFAFHVPFRGSLIKGLILFSAFVYALSGPALILAGVTRDRIKYSQISFMLSVPTFVTSGCVWPMDQMPIVLRGIIKCLWPLTHFATPFKDVIIKDMPLSSVSGAIGAMLLYGTITLWIGSLCYKKSKADSLDTIQIIYSIEG